MLHCRTLVKAVDIDVLLALDYIISMQYFRLFRWDAGGSAEGVLQLLQPHHSQQLLWQTPEAIEEFLDGLQATAERVQPGLYKAVWVMLKHPIRAAVEQAAATAAAAAAALIPEPEHWLYKQYHELQCEHSLPEWPQSYRKQEDGTWNHDSDPFGMASLKVWLHSKMAAETNSHLAGLHSSEHERQFT